ncbi:MAG TPA: 2-hydroxychromene-2-carboxylate isomerase [Casimicrobiaceae bacterium]|nr:2-hydroxychromene-2-carboxylate isomerase [Casimicrobiaceae bacterium]
MSAPIDFYFDFSSPYGFLGSEKIEALAGRHGRTVDWHPILLGVVFRQTGAMPLTEVPLKGAYSRRDFARSAKFHGVEGLRMPSRFPIPTQAAARIVLWTKAHDPARTAAVVHALYRAFFRDDADISQPDVAADAAARAGVDRVAARAAIDDPQIKEALKAENERAMAAGVFGSPFAIVDGEPFWGVDRFDQIERWLSNGGW